MPETPGDATSPKTTRELVQSARESFAYQLAELNRWPHAEVERGVLLAAFNNAITELVSVLEETAEELAETTRAHDALALELGELRALSTRKTYSALDPVCGRCLNLAAEAGESVSATHAGDGDACSRCGAVVVQQRVGETEAAWRERFRATSKAAHIASPKTQDKDKG
jgi:hypothetical protein